MNQLSIRIESWYIALRFQKSTTSNHFQDKHFNINKEKGINELQHQKIYRKANYLERLNISNFRYKFRGYFVV